jgi:large repetitive protein
LKYSDVSGGESLLRRLTSLILLAFLGLLTSQPVWGQALEANLSGTVTDANCAPVAGATVRASDEASNYVRETQTDSGGQYLIIGLPQGPYTVIITRQGFRGNETRGLGIPAGINVGVNVMLYDAGGGMPGVSPRC